MKLTIEKNEIGIISVFNEGFDAVEVLGLAAYLELTAKNHLINEMQRMDKVSKSSKKKNP